ncbi:alpha-amylase family glycosyl hydrolase [Pengzhenrongella frigida]|uniref:Alpha-amylase n=1 Tax=Pengzhenrongella frigida TaxID=1259133 RepID=A0A4Q5N0A6_9MICO|nr:alpha-amylase family glycosyl hydrolase [Cellulomonas sp. HLT2-17]RYV51459.1 alpha-amylase [Cellulomonas sp. HLT2-17]
MVNGDHGASPPVLVPAVGASRLARAPGWWRTAVVYQIYVRSFADSTGDGVGDLAGVTAHLDAVAWLGADAVWLTPFYPSPQADHGYDVADHRGVDPLFGDLAAFDALVARAHALDLGVVVDLVPNHVSDQHAWFREAVTSPPGAPARRRFHVRPGRGPGGALPPTGWTSMFGGPAWTRLPDGEWYLHLFAPEQPDLNWTHDAVRADFAATLAFWAARGVDGFRVDVAGGLAKDPAYGEVPARRDPPAVHPPAVHPHWDRPEVHEIYREWRSVLDDAGPDLFAVAEAWGPPERTAAFARPDELGQAFAFGLLGVPWSATAIRREVTAQLGAHGAVGALPAWVLSNHDSARVATRRGPAAALALHLFLLAMPGAFYLYAGDELGLPEVDVPRAAWKDPQAVRTGGRLPSRDGARIPLPWTADPPGFGFTTGTPWLPTPPGWGTHARDRQERDPHSPWGVLHRALTVRHDVWGGADAAGPLEWLPSPPGTLVARRGNAVVVLNASRRTWPLARLVRTGAAQLTVIAASGPLPGPLGSADPPVVSALVPPATAVWLVPSG